MVYFYKSNIIVYTSSYLILYILYKIMNLNQPSNQAEESCNFLHKGVTLCSDKQPSSAQGSVFFINYGHDSEVILKSVSNYFHISPSHLFSIVQEERHRFLSERNGCIEKTERYWWQYWRFSKANIAQRDWKLGRVHNKCKSKIQQRSLPNFNFISW